MKYNLEERPPLFSSLLYGLQWWIISLPCVIIMGTVISKMHFSQLSDQILYMQKLFAIAGITTILQVSWGHRLPLIIGPASVLLVGITASLSAGISIIYTSIIIGGLIVSIIAYSGILTKIRCIFTPRVVTVILMLVPFTLMPVILKLIFENNNNLLFNIGYTFVFVIILLICNKLFKGIWKSTIVLCGILLGSLIYFCIFNFPGQINVSYNINEIADSFFIDKPEFDLGTILAFLFCFLAFIVNELGSIEAVALMLKADNIGKRVKNGVGIAGLSNIMSGTMGIIGSIDYSMSSGIIAATGCASRFTLIPSGIGLIICAFLPQFIILLNFIPSIVMGALLIYLMAGQLSSGLSMVIEEKAVHNFNDGVIVGLPIMIAVLISFAPQSAMATIPSLIRPIIGNGFVIGVLFVLILEHAVFRKKISDSK